ncbi:MAG: T9SS type A sorting domain-containing protein [Bacteroidota bacterium]
MKSCKLLFFALFVSCTAFAQGPITAPAAPTLAAEDVISLFSDSYTDVAVNTFLTDWSMATLSDTLIDGVNMKRYSSLDFAGIEMTGANAIDLETAGMTHLHLDFWSANSTTFRVKLVDFGGDGFGGANADTEAEVANDLAAETWVSLDLALTEFAGMNQSDVSQFIISSLPAGMSDVYLTNVYFYDDGNMPMPLAAPTTAPEAPTEAAEDVISLFSDGYTDVPVDTYLTEWSAASLTDTMIAGTNMKHYSGLDFAGIEMTGANALDLMAAEMTHLHLDFWSANSTTFRVKLVDFGGDGFGGDNDTDAEVANDLANNEWVSLDLRLTEFAGMNQTDISQFIVSSLPTGTSDVYLTNVYFYAGEALGEQMDLPVTFEEEGVDYGVNDFAGAASMITADPEDAMNTVVATTKTAGAATFAGTTLTSAVEDAPAGFATAIPFTAGVTTMSVRVWSPTAGTPVMLKVEQVGEPAVSVETLTDTRVAGAWDTLVFDFSVQRPETAPLNLDATYNLASIFFDFGSEPTEDATYYWDNVEFGGVVVEPGPLTAAPTPTRDAAEVISLFSDAYDNVTVDTFFAEFSTGSLTDTLIEGNPTLLYRNLNFAGIETLGDNAIDLEAAGMTHLHLNVWSANSTTFRTKLVDFGGDGFGNGNDTEFEIARELPQREWVTVEYPLPAFVGVNLTDISQIIISSLPVDVSNVYIDNIYFYQGEPLGEQMTLPVTFDEEGIDYGLQDFEGTASMLVADPEDAMNTVAQTTKTAGAATFAGTTLTSTEGGPEGFAARIPLTAEASTMTVRVWSPTMGTPVMLKVEKIGDPTVSVETLVNTTVAGAWDTLTFDFTNERTGTAAINFSENYGKATIFFDFDTSPTEDATYYWDDVQFGSGNTGGGDDEPMEAAPTPTRDAANVISMFSEAYTNVPVDTWRTDWSMATLEDIEIAGNATKKYTGLDFVGVETVVNPIDLTTAGMTHLHVDYWTPNMDTMRIKLVDFGMDGFGGDNDTEDELIFMTTKGEWIGLDIPLEDFMDMNQTDISQFILSGLPTGLGTLYLDNVYYYKAIVDGTNTPTVGLLEAFPNPIADVVNIIAPVRMDRLTLFNANGQVVGNWQPNAEQFAVPMDHLPTGNYVALVSTNSGLMTIKLLKQ